MQQKLFTTAVILGLLLSTAVQASQRDIIAQNSADLTNNYQQSNEYRTKICLNGVWKIALAKKLSKEPPVDPANFGYVVVPSSWLHTTDFPIYGNAKFKAGKFNGQGKWNGKSVKSYPYAWYQREFIVPASWKNKAVFVKFDRLTISGTVFLNGHKLGSQNERDETSWNISKYLTYNAPNKLDVRIAAYMDETIKLFLGAEMTSTHKAKANLRGITQDVWLYAYSENPTVADLFINTSFRNKDISFELTINNPKSLKTQAKITLLINNKGEKKEVKRFSHGFVLNGKKKQVVRFKKTWVDATLWETDKPHLYQAVADLDINGEMVDKSFPVTFGFREVWIDGKDVVMNGKPIHFRSVHIGSHDAFVNTAAKNAQQKIDLYRQAGYNSLQLGSEGVWRKGHSAQFYDEILDIADRQGLPVFAPVLPVNAVDMANPVEFKEWQKTVRDYIKKYRNHPSIVMWSLNFNYLGYPWDMNPHVLGTDYQPSPTILFLGDKRKKAAASEAFVASVDPSRELYHHAGGNYGKLSTSNFYVAWPPLQEREDYFSKWAKKGIKPFMAVELGLPSTLDFLRARVGNYNTVRYSEVLEAEYGASYLGPKAYELQSDTYLNMISANATDKTTAGCDKYNVNGPYFWGYRLTLHEPFKSIMETIYPAYLRSWRTYGVTGYSPNSGAIEIMGKQWQPWHGVKGRYSYPDLTVPGAKPLTYYIPKETKITDTGKKYAKAQKPVLIYVGGCRDNGFSSKDHAFYAGDMLKKQIVVVNHSRQELKTAVTWDVVDAAGNTVKKGTETVTVAAGKNGFTPFEFKVPDVKGRTEFNIKLSCNGIDLSKVGIWDLPIEVFPKSVFDFSGNVALFDPVGDTAKALKKLGVAFEDITRGRKLQKADVIIIGRNSLSKAGEVMPNIINAVNSGKTLICLAQPSLSEFGLRMHKRGVHRAFILAKDHLLVQGLKNADFENWRGKSTMTKPYPESSKATEDNYPEEPWKWGNRGVICSYMIEKPHTGNSLSILETEFDLGYSPLVEFSEGKGRMIMCQLDICDRVGVDPVATTILERLLTYAESSPKLKESVYACNAETKEMLVGLKTVMVADLKSAGVAVLKGAAPGGEKQQIIEFIKNGGTLVLVGQQALKDSHWLPVPVKLKKKRFYKAVPLVHRGIVQGISTSDLFIKDRFKGKVILPGSGVQVLTKPGIIAEAGLGKGKIVYMAIDPERYKNSKITPERMNRIYHKLSRTLVALIRNSGGQYDMLSRKYLAGDSLKNIALPAKWKFAIDPRNKGRRKKWYKPSFDDSKWQLLNVPGYWESQGVNDPNRRFVDAKKPYNGYAWYRCKVVIPEAYKGKKLKLMLGAIDDMDTTYFNGQKIGVTGPETKDYYAFVRDYPIPEQLIKYGEENDIAIKVFDNYGQGGIVGPNLYIHPAVTSTYPYLNKKAPFNPYKLKRW